MKLRFGPSILLPSLGKKEEEGKETYVLGRLVERLSFHSCVAKDMGVDGNEPRNTISQDSLEVAVFATQGQDRYLCSTTYSPNFIKGPPT
jgi:hypothetical protein